MLPCFMVNKAYQAARLSVHHHHHHHRRGRVAGDGRRVVAPPCPRSTARLQRSPVGIGVNSYWAQGLKPPPHIYDQGARLYDEPPTFVT